MVDRGGLSHSLKHVAPMVGVEETANKIYMYNRVQNRIQELIEEFKASVAEHCAPQGPAIAQQLANFESSCVFERRDYANRPKISQSDANGIRVAASFLPMEADCQTELEEIKEQIKQTKEKILEYDGDEHLQRFLFEMQAICVEAIDEFELLGPRRLKKRLEEMLGRMFRESIYNTAGRKEVAKAIDKSGVFKLLIMLDSIHAKVEQYKPMLTTLAKTLLLGDGGIG